MEIIRDGRHPAEMRNKGVFGTQKIVRFPNTYGASIVRTNFSYGGDRGLFELAVIKFNSASRDDWNINYDTPITNDVLGYLSEEDVERTLKLIEAL